MDEQKCMPEGPVRFVSLGKGRWMAIDLSKGEENALSATGGNRRDALRNLEIRMDGGTPPNEKPHLVLCKACNKRAAELGEEHCAVHGVEVCHACAEAIDRWGIEMKKWRRREMTKRARKQRRARRSKR